MEVAPSTKELQKLYQKLVLSNFQKQDLEIQLEQTFITKQDRKQFKRNKKILETLNEAIEEPQEYKNYFQKYLDSTQNKTNSAETNVT